MKELRPYRGWVRTSLTAGIVMSGIATGALVVGLATGLVPSSMFGGRELIAVAIRGFGLGVVAGGLFGWLVARRAGGQSLAELPTRRIALWGGLATAGGILLTGLMMPGIVPVGILAASVITAGLGGSAVSAGMLRLARRSEQSLKGPDRHADRLIP
ncbi:MAG TPA: hypothetical protein VGM50_04215 [Gemmatimonadaceae bacterium]|jgi:hypothetical protein